MLLETAMSIDEIAEAMAASGMIDKVDLRPVGEIGWESRMDLWRTHLDACLTMERVASVC